MRKVNHKSKARLMALMGILTMALSYGTNARGSVEKNYTTTYNAQNISQLFGPDLTGGALRGLPNKLDIEALQEVQISLKDALGQFGNLLVECVQKQLPQTSSIIFLQTLGGYVEYLLPAAYTPFAKGIFLASQIAAVASSYPAKARPLFLTVLAGTSLICAAKEMFSTTNLEETENE